MMSNQLIHLPDIIQPLVEEHAVAITIHLYEGYVCAIGNHTHVSKSNTRKSSKSNIVFSCNGYKLE